MSTASWSHPDRPNSVLPKGALGTALGYLDKNWEKLIRYTDDGDVNIDNNLAENAIRPFVIGRKNWLFSATPKGTHASASLYSLIAQQRPMVLNRTRICATCLQHCRA